jgi:hypothetical protein
MSSFLRALTIGAICVGFGSGAFSKDLNSKESDEDDGAAKQTSGAPTIYLDLRTNYGTVPAGSLPIGLGSPALFTALQALASPTGNPLLTLPISLPLAARQAVWVDVPATVDVTDRVSLYAGITGSSTRIGTEGWSVFAVTSWNVGFQADLYEQNGGSIPTITWQSTITESIPNGQLATTNFNNILEFDYAFDKDETRGALAGFQDTRLEVGSALARIHPYIIGYVGGYYQWPNNWKFTGRVGVQYFGGAQILNLTPVQPFTQPILRLDIDRMDDNDNRLFGVTAQIMWVPKPSYQLTIRTPLYAVRN